MRVRGALRTRAAVRACFGLWLVLALLALHAATQPGSGRSAGPTVYPFPIPGAAAALPGTQVAFRGQVPDISTIQVRGSSSGLHAGVVMSDSDRQGGSFIPSTPFAPGEVVTVKTSMNIAGGQGGSYHFTVADPAPRRIMAGRVTSPHVRRSVERFASRPDLAPAAIRIVKNSRHTDPGDLFLEPQSSPVQDGPEIRDWRGRLIWFMRLPKGQYVSDFRVQHLAGQPVLTWWQGYINGGVGNGLDVIADNKYRPVGYVRGVGGALPDLHEFRLSRRGTALITSYYPVYWNEQSVGGPARAIVLAALVQEIDVHTGLLLFEWNALDHIALGESYRHRWTNPDRAWDFFHVNSIQDLDDGNLLISGRDTWAAYKINRLTGDVIWRLGGRRSSFRMGPGTGFAFQHDVQLRAHDIVSMFDDGAGPPVIHGHSRILGLRLHFRPKRASLAFSWSHSPSTLSFFEGNAQELPRGHYFSGWGLKPYFSEFNSAGRMIFDGRFICDCFHNRAYRFRWSATPATVPDLAVRRRGGGVTIYASWNGATGIGYWRVLAGPRPNRLHRVRRARATGFETAIAVRSSRYVAVVALDSRGHPMSGQSQAVRG